MKQLILFVAMFTAAVAVCSAEGYQLSGVSGGYKVVMNFAQTRPMEGENSVEIAITGNSSRSVKGARVTVEYFMPSLPGKSPMMDNTTTAKPDRDVYKATLHLDMKGEWKAVVSIVTGKDKETVTFPFELK